MHFMLDLETLSTAPDAAITSIGLAAFVPETGAIIEELSLAVSLDDAIRRGSVSGDTLRFWSEQPQAIRDEAWGGNLPLPTALYEVRKLLLRHADTPADVFLWAKPATFDVTALTNGYIACGFPLPWHYRSPRDVNTLLMLTPPTKLVRDAATEHSAIGDVRWQIALVAEAMQYLAGGKDG